MITRFAPSPSGLLHLGHVVSALYVWGVAKSLQAKVFLRIEDHDRQRSKPHFVDAIIEDLCWLGFIESNSAYQQQSLNQDRYEKALRFLASKGLVYGCKCSRKSILASSPQSGHDELHYPGTCRDSGLAFDDPECNSVRFRVGDDKIAFTDMFCGEIVQHPAKQCGDISLKDGLGNFTYHFSNVVDDIAENVNLIVRGQDILPSTGRQLLLRRALGCQKEVRFFHHPLLMADSSEDKLSKTNSSTSIASMREDGLSAEDIIGLAAFKAKFQTCNKPLSLSQGLSLLRERA